MNDIVAAWKGLVAIASLVLGGSPEAPERILNGPPVSLTLGTTSLCIPRNYIDPFALKRTVRGGTTMPVPYGRLELSMFTPELTGFTPAHYASGLSNTTDKREYPGDWVRITIRERGSSSPRDISSLIRSGYEKNSFMDHGFVSHPAQRNCVGKIVGLGYTQIQLGPDCLKHELKYGHPSNPSVVLSCGEERCSVADVLELRGTWYQYDFPRYFLENWADLDTRIRDRLDEWKDLQACDKKG